MVLPPWRHDNWNNSDLCAGKHEYLSSENVVHRESHIFHRNGHITARAGHQASPADPYRREEGRTWRTALESTMGSDHREGLAAGIAFLAGPTGCPAILPAIL
jgi:hypothetical protein